VLRGRAVRLLRHPLPGGGCRPGRGGAGTAAHLPRRRLHPGRGRDGATRGHVPHLG
jgi:hypothetical protein